MILDRLELAHRYYGMHPLFADAFAWARDPANRRLANGRHPICGDDLFALVDAGQTAPARDKRFESHRRYIDIQLCLQGPELMEWTPVPGLAVVQDFEPGNDIRFHAEPAHITRLVVGPEQFAIFYPDDAHKPCCQVDGQAVAFRKMVFKVALLPTVQG